MKYICKHACIWRDVYVTPDTVVDMTDEELKTKKPQIDGSFAPLGENGVPVEKDTPDDHGMTKAQYREMLSRVGVNPPRTASRDDLRKLFEQYNRQQTETKKDIH